MTAKPNQAPAVDDHQRSTVYVMVWALLALLALGYLTLLAIRPDLAANMIINPPIGSPEGNQGQRAMFRALAEIQDLKKSVTKLQGDIAEIRTATTADRQRMLELEARVAAAEARAKAAVPIAEASPAAHKQAASSTAETPEAISGVSVQGQVVEAGPTTKKDAKPPVQKAGTTAGWTAAEVVPAAAEPTPQAQPMGLLISSGPSLDAMRLTWQLLLEGHRSTLRTLEPRVVETPGDPPSYQLIAGPSASREAAAKACERLKAKQTRCSVIPFAGQPL